MSEFRVKKITSGRGQETTFTYSSDNKVSLISLSDSTKVTFAYNGNTITQTVTSPQSPMPRIEMLHLTATGYVDSSKVAGPMGNNLSLSTHDAEGHTTLSQDYSSGVLRRSTESKFKDGNETARTISDDKSQPIGTIFFDYYTDKPNSLAPENQGMKFIGQDSKNLMKKVVQVLAKGDTIGTGNFYYKFDDKGRAISKATYDGKGMLQDSTTFTYY